MRVVSRTDESSLSERAVLLACLGLGLGAAVALGLARFAYALVLPSMQADLGWTYAEAGALNAANAAGYLVGALATARLVGLFGAARVFTVGIALTTAALAATPLGQSFTALLGLRFAPGLTGGLVFVAGGLLAARLASALASRAALGIGLFYAGPGIGIALSGVLVPLVLEAGQGGWRAAWTALGLLALPLAGAAAVAALPAHRAPPPALRGGGSAPVSLAPALAAYALFAAGYIGYMTFIVATIRERGAGALEAGLLWSALGLSAAASGWIWSGLLQRSRDGRGMALLAGLGTFACLLPLLGGAPLLASSVLFGASFLAVVAATTNLVRFARDPAHWPAWIGHFTVAFGVGQTVGPLLSGAAADWQGSTDGVLWASAALLGLAAVLALRQRSVS